MSTLHVSKYTQSNQYPVLALLHGWGSSSKIWQPCVAELSQKFQVWCIDLPGHGKSLNVRWNESAEQGLTLLAETLPSSCILIGWSLGGLLAQLYVNEFPTRVQNLMLVSSTPKFVACQGWPQGMPQARFNDFKQGFTSSPQKTLKRFNVLQVLHSEASKDITYALNHAASTQQLEKIGWGLQWLADVDLRNSRSLQDFPGQKLQGEEDQVSFALAARDTAQLWGNVKLTMIENSGHVPFLSHKQKFIEQVRSII